MKNQSPNYLITCFLITLIGLFLITGYRPPVAVNAQTPAQVIITWQANNFYPANYRGKPPASQNVPIVVSAEVTVGGKLLDLSGADFIWYADNKLIGKGKGAKEIVWNGSKAGDGDYFIRVAIELKNEKFENAIRIPISKPVAVIESLPTSAVAPAGGEVFLQIIPYFFSVASLNELDFSWNVNEKKISGSSNQLTLKVGTPQSPDQNKVQISAFVQNRFNALEFTGAKTALTISK